MIVGSMLALGLLWALSEAPDVFPSDVLLLIPLGILGFTVAYIAETSQPPPWAALAAAAAVGPLMMGAAYVPLLARDRRVRRKHRSPVAGLVRHLAEVLGPVSSQPDEATPVSRDGDEDTKRAIVALGRAASRMRHDYARRGIRTGSSARAQALDRRARRVEAWLHEQQGRLVALDDRDEVRVTVAVGLCALARGDWSLIEREPEPPSRPFIIRQVLPRLAGAGALIGAALLLPDLLPHHLLTSDQQQRLQFAVIVSSIGAFLTPKQAVTDALKDVRDTMSRAPSK
jgi:hypothetical protein